MTLGALVSGTLQLLWPARCAGVRSRRSPTGAVLRRLQACRSTRSAAPARGARCRARDRATALDGRRCRRCRRVPFPFREARGGLRVRRGAGRGHRADEARRRRYLARRLARLLVPPLADALARGGFGADDAGRSRAAARAAACASAASTRRSSWRAGRCAASRARRRSRRAPRGLPRLERHLLHRTRADARARARGPGGALGRGRGRLRGQRQPRARPRPARPARRRRLHDRRDLQRVRRRPAARRRAAVTCSPSPARCDSGESRTD